MEVKFSTPTVLAITVNTVSEIAHTSVDITNEPVTGCEVTIGRHSRCRSRD
jgi:hypothetical protein